jgi:hypothetical protein
MPPSAVKKVKMELDAVLQEINMNTGADADEQGPPKRPRLDTTPVINIFTTFENFQKIQDVLGLQIDRRFGDIT